MSDQKGGKNNKYKIIFRNGTTKILSGFAEEQVQNMARQEDEKTPVAALVEITKDQGGIPISFR